MKTETVENLTLELRRSFPVPRERLFNAWTDPAEVRHWFGPEGANVLDVKMDVRVGGRYLISVKGCEGDTTNTVVGEFREVTPPSKVEYTWRWDGDSDWDGVESVVTVEFLERAGGSELRLTHRGFPSEESRNRHEHGWTGTLEKLARTVQA